MRTCTVFYAFDGTEFFDHAECLAYEESALDCLKEINDTYTFFDKNLKTFCAPLGSSDVDDWVDWFTLAGNECEIIHRDANLSRSAENFIFDVTGLGFLNDDFDKKLGWFRYDYDLYEWHKMDDQSILFFLLNSRPAAVII